MKPFALHLISLTACWPVGLATAAVTYHGGADPRSTGWRVVSSGTGSQTRVAEDASEPAWEIRDPPGGGWLKYTHSLPDGLLEGNAGWTVTARVRFGGSGQSRQVGQLLRVHESKGYWIFDLRSGAEPGLYGYAGWLNHFRPDDGKFHSIQMRVPPNLDRAIYFIDGHRIGHAVRKKVKAGERSVEFGTASGGHNPDRLLHGPADVKTPNGDRLRCYQDSADHIGVDVISQVRSRLTAKPGGATRTPGGCLLFVLHPGRRAGFETFGLDGTLATQSRLRFAIRGFDLQHLWRGERHSRRSRSRNTRSISGNSV